MADPRQPPLATLGFVKLVLPDIDAAERFYTAGLGMARRRQVEGPTFREVMLATPGGDFTLVLFQWRDGRALQQGTAHGPVGFLTHDLDLLLQRLLDLGATLKNGPVQGGGMRAVFLYSPDGHEIELLQRIQTEAA